MGEYLASIGPDDLVILFGLRRRIAKNDQIRSSVIRSGAAFSYITDESVPPEQDAAWHFRCHTESAGPLFSHTSVMALLNLITNRAIELAGAEGRTRLQHIESCNDAVGEL